MKLAEETLGRYDALARLLFAVWQVYSVANGATPVILVFTVFEIAFGVAQAMPYGVSRNDSSVRAAPLAS